jgi:hypothetical protein
MISSKTESEADISMLQNVYALKSFSDSLKRENKEASFIVDASPHLQNNNHYLH